MNKRHKKTAKIIQNKTFIHPYDNNRHKTTIKQRQQTTSKINIAPTVQELGVPWHYSKGTALFATDRFLIRVDRFSFICTIRFYSEHEM